MLVMIIHVYKQNIITKGAFGIPQYWWHVYLSLIAKWDHPSFLPDQSELQLG